MGGLKAVLRIADNNKKELTSQKTEINLNTFLNSMLHLWRQKNWLESSMLDILNLVEHKRYLTHVN